MTSRSDRGRPSHGAPVTAPRLALATLGLIAIGSGCGSSKGAGTTTTTAAPSTAAQQAGMTAGLPFQDPPDLNTNTPANLQLRLVAEPGQFDVAGKQVSGDSYDGGYVAPTMHFQPGEHVDLTLVNRLSTATNLHFHGMHVSPSGNADNPFLTVTPGQSLTYHLDIPMDQPQGTFWYHDHEMCGGTESMSMPGMTASASPASGCMDVESQIFAGLSGAIVIGDDRSLLPANLQHITTHTLEFKDVQIDKSGRIVQNGGATSINSNDPTVRLVNGELQPILTMLPGETQLWRLANIGADIFYDLQLQGYTFTVVGEDGYPASQITTSNSLLLPPGKRYDVLVTAGPHPGKSWLRTLAYSNGPQGDLYPEAQLLSLHVAGTPMAPAAMPSGSIPTSSANLATASIAADRTVTLSENKAGTIMYINGKQFDMNTSVFSRPAVVGTIEQWTIVNESGEVHPFHLHTEHFQVMSINGVPKVFSGPQDIIPVPYKQNGDPGRVVIRIGFTDFTGKIMFHCHIAAHEDAGMMSFVDVVS